MDRRKRERSAVTHIPPRLSADAVLRKSMRLARLTTTEKFVVVGASTGGSEALPMDAPGVIVVQHMPEGFTAQFARRLDRQCQVRVSAAATYAGKNAVGVIMTGMGDDGARGMLCSDVRHAHTPKLIVRRRQRQTPRRCCV